MFKPWGGHFIVKLNTTCEQSLLPLYTIDNFEIYDIFSTYTERNLFFPVV